MTYKTEPWWPEAENDDTIFTKHEHPIIFKLVLDPAIVKQNAYYLTMLTSTLERPIGHV